MDVIDRDRSVRVTQSLGLINAPFVTLDGAWETYLPVSLKITYTNGRFSNADWKLETRKIRRDGTVGNATKGLSAFDFVGGRWNVSQAELDAAVPSWLQDLVSKYRPKSLAI